MNNKTYWKTRKWILFIIFTCKKWLFRGTEAVECALEGIPFNLVLMKMIIRKGIVGLLLAIIALFIDENLFGMWESVIGLSVPVVNGSTFVDVLIGSIGVAGVILGLYCSNISTIYSVQYANAPEQISNAFQYDRLTCNCISNIISFIIFDFIVTAEILLGRSISWISVTIAIIWAIMVLISYSITKNRTYYISDVYRLADDSYRSLNRTITKEFRRNCFSTDINFQYAFRKEAEKHIGLLKAIQRYGVKNHNSDKSTMVEFICKNHMLMEQYWNEKQNIGKESLWFKDEAQYQKWHLSNETEVSLALRTGTALRPKKTQNFWWFEDEIMSINRACLLELIEKDEKDYTSLYTYFFAFNKSIHTVIEHKEISYYVRQVNWMQNLLKTNIVIKADNSGERKAFVGSIESLSLVYLELILEAGNYFKNININQLTREVVNEIDSTISVEKSSLLRGKYNTDYFEKIIMEIQVEGQRITPEWLIKQWIAKEEYDYLNEVVENISKGIDSLFSLGEYFLERNCLFEACILFSRFYEYESKIGIFISITQSYELDLRKCQIDSSKPWADTRTEELHNILMSWKEKIPDLLFRCAGEFTLKNWENREDYPDFLGESFNHICEDAIDSIVNNNLKQFGNDFGCLTKMMLLYQEYIRTDFIRNKDNYRSEYMYYTFTSPIAEWAQIGGLAIIWGEFYSQKEWEKIVSSEANTILTKEGTVTDLAGRIIKYIQNRDEFMLGVGGRGILETEWNMYVENAIRNSGICELENEFYRTHLKTNSKLLKAFCSEFFEMGFMNNPAEVFWVICVNPLLPKEQRFHTRHSWEDSL